MKKIAIDITDLIFWDKLFFTGIQKVSFNLSYYISKLSPDDFIFCYFNKKDHYFHELKIIDKNYSKKNFFKNNISKERKLCFKNLGKFVFLGASWEQKEAIESIVNIKKEYSDLEIGHIIYDLTPIVTPQFHNALLSKAFEAWMKNIFNVCDFYIFISKHTRNDFLKYFQILNIKNFLISLSSDLISIDESNELSTKQKSPFIACIGTIEPRKNHLLIYYAYKLLLSENKIPPKLLIIGSKGWESDLIFQCLYEDDQLSPYISILSLVTDEEIVGLVKSSLFTIYPSFYEGWGLPVTESLAFGKLCLSSNSSSLPEAGGEFADYFNPLSSRELADKIMMYSENEELLKQKEQFIKERFHFQTWEEITTKFIFEVSLM
jgi:glycosyltransferase involved in cell wall biosynthesis